MNFIYTSFEKFINENHKYEELIKSIINYNTNIDPSKLPNKKGHYIDNLPKNTEKILIDSSFFEKESDAWNKVSKNKIAYHDRPKNDKYWNKWIYKEPVILIDYYEANNELRVVDGNHRLNVYLNNGYKKIPSVLTKKAKDFIIKNHSHFNILKKNI